VHDLIALAEDYATRAHARIDQRRKYSNQPYDVHLRSVARLVAEVSSDEQMIAAAWLHDTVEDTPATFRDIEQVFGRDVAQLVAELTDVSRPGDGNRSTRKAIDRAHLAAASDRAKTVKLADLIDNCRDICRHDPRFARVFADEMEALLVVLEGGDPTLLRRAHKTLEKCRNTLMQDDADAMPDGESPPPLDISRNQRHALKLFTTAFSAADIADPLASFDADASASEAKHAMERGGWEVAGLREHGLITGYLRRQDLQEGNCADFRRGFFRNQVVGADSSLSEVIFVLTRHSTCFVEILGEVSGAIRRDHIQRPVVRMWLFGMITLIEMTMAKRIEKRYPNDDWTDQLSAGRLAKAHDLRKERERRGHKPRLADCLQLSDRMQILMKDDEDLDWMGFPSRRVAKHVAKEFESLRNNLAHAQDIVTSDWPQIARMTQRIERVVGIGAD
jgi:hypothetical protein